MFKPDVFLKKVSVTHFQSKKKVQLLTLEERNIPAFFFFFDDSVPHARFPGTYFLIFFFNKSKPNAVLVQ